MQTADGQIVEPHSISADLDYPGIGPLHAHLWETGRARFYSITDDEALVAFQQVAKLEGILPALESSHAFAQAAKLAPNMKRDEILLINLSGRGDKDCQEVARLLAK